MIIKIGEVEIETDYDLEQIIFIRLDNSGLRGIIIGIEIDVTHSILYKVAWADNKTDTHYACELTEQRENF